MLRLKNKPEERKAFSAPIRATPVEILTEIFLLASTFDRDLYLLFGIAIQGFFYIRFYTIHRL